MDKFDVEESVIESVSHFTKYALDCIEVEDSLGEDLGLDSLDIIEMGLDVEDCFDIHIPDADMNKWVTVQDVVNSVIKLLEEV